MSDVSILGMDIMKPYILLQSLPAVPPSLIPSPAVQILIYLVNNLLNTVYST